MVVLMKETTLVTKIKKALEAEGAKVIKIHGGPNMEAGTPDLIGCYRGQCFCLEVKRDKNLRATPLQIKRLKEWAQAGAEVGVVASVEMALEVMKG